MRINQLIQLADVIHMIDTIVLTLSQDMYHISEPDRFSPSARWVLAESAKKYTGITSKQNPTKKDLLNGIYKPRLTLRRQGYVGQALAHHSDIVLKIELSLPKLVYGNNFNELQYKDFKHVTEKLTLVLETMGVIVSAATLANAPVLAIHYSKNIALTDGSIPYHYINKIKEANVKLALDVSESMYRNDGHSYRWHCNSYEVVFYDKIRDLDFAKQNSKRSLETDSELQQHLFKKFEKRHMLEFLRMEVRLNKRAKMKQLFKALDIKADLTLKKLFKPAIAKKMLLHYIDEIENKRSPLFDFVTTNDKSFLAKLAFNNPKISPKQAAIALGLKHMLEIGPVRELKVMIGKNNPQGWSKLMKEVQLLRMPTMQSPFKVIREQLVLFKPIKIPSDLVQSISGAAARIFP